MELHDDEIPGTLRFIGEWLATEMGWSGSANTLFLIADKLDELMI